VAHAQIVTDYLYVTDYGLKDLDRYSFSFNTTTNQIVSGFTADGYGNSSASAVFITGDVKEGLQGTASDLIVVEGDGGTIGRYNLNGNKIGDIVVTGFPVGTPQGFTTVGNVAITADGKFMYAPDQSNGYIYKINLATGAIVDSVPFAGAHDVAIGSDGTIYAAAYRQSSGIVTFDASLDAISQRTLVSGTVIPAVTGISLTHDSLGNTTGIYAMSQSPTNNQENGPDSVYHFTLTGSGVGQTAVLANGNPNNANGAPDSFANLRFSFGNTIGPDGNVYSAELGAIFGNNPGYTGGVYEYNTASMTTSLAIAGQTNGGASSGPSGLDAPKYLQFSTNFITVPDAGYDVPEPGAAAILAGLLFSATGVLLRRKRRE